MIIITFLGLWFGKFRVRGEEEFEFLIPAGVFLISAFIAYTVGFS